MKSYYMVTKVGNYMVVSKNGKQIDKFKLDADYSEMGVLARTRFLTNLVKGYITKDHKIVSCANKSDGLIFMTEKESLC